MLGNFNEIEFSPYKWTAHIDKLRALAEGKDIYPVTVELDLVNYCNHNCGWCVDPGHGQSSLSQETAMNILAELKKLGVSGIVLKGGGEPTLNNSFSEVLSYAHQLSFEVGVVTNGSRLLELHKDIVGHAAYVRVSIDGPTADTHRRVHGSNDFNKITEGVNQLVGLRDREKRRHPIIGLSFAMDYERIDVVPAAADLGRQLKVDYVLLRPPFFEEVGRKNTMHPEQKKSLFMAFERVQQACSKNIKILIDYWISDAEWQHSQTRCASSGISPRRGNSVGKAGNGIEHETGYCWASPLMAVIAADGAVYPCCNLRYLPEWRLGTINYFQGLSFESIWQSSKRKALKDATLKTECIHFCTHPLSKYNEIIRYLKSPGYHKGFV